MAKLRITLFGPGWNGLISDRLVEQDLELTNGPKDKHDGPIRLEANLESQDDVNGLIEYLRKLIGDLPISPRAEKKLQPKKTATLMGIEPLNDLLHTATNKYKTQEAMIEYLRSLQFVFVSYQGLVDIHEENNYPLKLKEKHQGYQFMLRRTKFAKNPKHDKYDGQLVFAIKIIGDRVMKFQVYMFGKYKETINMDWADTKNFNFKKVDKVYKFPDMMDYVERLRWRQEHRKVQADEKYEASKFYNKWAPHIKINKA